MRGHEDVGVEEEEEGRGRWYMRGRDAGFEEGGKAWRRRRGEEVGW